MKICKTLLILTGALTASVNAHGATTFLYTFSFIENSPWPATTIIYSGAQLPASGQILSLDHISGDVNGCAPPLIQASFNTATEVVFGPTGGESPVCAGTASGVVGFAFYVENAFNLGTFETTGAGRVVKNDTGDLTYYFAGGSLNIREGVTASPVPEPGAALLTITVLLLIALARIDHFTIPSLRSHPKADVDSL